MLNFPSNPVLNQTYGNYRWTGYAWAPVLTGSGGGINEAPTEGADYVRNSADWTLLNWGTLDGKPATFPPSDHEHEIEDVTGLQTELDDIDTVLAGKVGTGVTDILRQQQQGMIRGLIGGVMHRLGGLEARIRGVQSRIPRASGVSQTGAHAAVLSSYVPVAEEVIVASGPTLMMIGTIQFNNATAGVVNMIARMGLVGVVDFDEWRMSNLQVGLSNTMTIQGHSATVAPGMSYTVRLSGRQDGSAAGLNAFGRVMAWSF